MRIAAIVAIVAALAAPAAAAAPVDELYSEFGLFGTWAGDCRQPTSPANPQVSIITPGPGLVLEVHDLGPDYETNRYSVLEAERVSARELAVHVIFQPGGEGEERQKLVFLIRDGTRRTLFNQPDGGAVRVRDGIALARGTKTLVLHKCEQDGPPASNVQ